MGANTSNALFYLISTLFEVYLWIIMVRVILQFVRADFYNPISQLVWQLTQPVVRPLQAVFPKVRQLDVAAVLVLVLVAVLYVFVAMAILQRPVDLLTALVLAALKLVVLLLNLYTFTLVIQAILSWVGPGVNNPAGSVLWSINEPLLRPVRRVIPPFSGLDLSPLIVIVLLQTLNRLIPLGILR